MKLNEIRKLATKDGFYKAIKEMKPSNRFVVGFIVVVLFLGLVRLVLNPGHHDYETLVAQETESTDSLKITETAEETVVGELKEPTATTPQDGEKNEIKKELKQPYYTKPIRSWSDKEFSDLNDVQLPSARKNGLKHRVLSRDEAELLVSQGGLVFSGASPLFCVDDNVKHSIPYLVPKAHRLLNRVAINFVDSLQAKNIPLCKLIVTSLLRTDEDVQKLKRVNVNAVTQSCHGYATTFDITYNRFEELDGNDQNDIYAKYGVLLKRALGEVLRDLRYEGRCYVKHERQQGCFHVTVR